MTTAASAAAKVVAEPPRGVIEVVGPEGVPLTFEAATIAERITAYCLDLFIVALTYVVIYILGVVVMMVTHLAEPLALTMAVAFLLWNFYFVVFEVRWQGATPGKRLLGLKVVSADGRGLTTDAIVARNLLRDLEVLVPLVTIFSPETLFGEAPWWMRFPTGAWLIAMVSLPFITRERARAGDLVGGTRVVRVPKVDLRRDEAVRDSFVPGEVDPWLLAPGQLAIYGEKELETLASLLRDAKAERVTHADLLLVAQTIARKVQIPVASVHDDPGRFLRSFYEQQRAHLERRLLFGKRKASKEDSRD